MLFLYIVLSVLISLFIYLIVDYRGPRKITLRPDIAFHMKCLRARELIVQEIDKAGSVWATRGLLLYRLKKGEDKFIRVAHVSTGLSYIWLNNFTLFRKLTNKPECFEVTIGDSGHICAMSDGRMWHRSVISGRFRETLKLRHFGLGVGRGILSNGLLSLDTGLVYFGEYFRNQGRSNVHIYRSGDQGQTWRVAYTFEPGVIRHVHALQKDPYTCRLWLCTGDDDREAMIAWSNNGFKDIHQIGTGSQIWRTTQLVFTEEAIYWGTDTGSVELAGIYRWDRKSEALSQVHKSAGAILFGTRLHGGTLVFSTDREGFSNEKDKKTRLILIGRDGQVREIACGTWKHWQKGVRYSFAMLRSPRNQGYSSQVISVINQKEFPSGELLLFDEAVLKGMIDVGDV